MCSPKSALGKKFLLVFTCVRVCVNVCNATEIHNKQRSSPPLLPTHTYITRLQKYNICKRNAQLNTTLYGRLGESTMHLTTKSMFGIQVSGSRT
jgi:hypothetical protein